VTKSDAESPILASVHEAAAGLHKAGLIGEPVMSAFNVLCRNSSLASRDGASVSIRRRGKSRG